MDRTLEFYDRNSREMTQTYEGVELRRGTGLVTSRCTPGARVLELGCGSGRDAAALLAHGFDVQAVDGSAGMLKEAESLHPELAGRLRQTVLPGDLPFQDSSFDAVMSWAVLMHLERDQIPAAFLEASRVLKHGGTLVYSVSVSRPGLDSEGRDDRGRYFSCLGAETWERLHTDAGFQTLQTQMSDDVIGRDGIRWATFVAVLP